MTENEIMMAIKGRLAIDPIAIEIGKEVALMHSEAALPDDNDRYYRYTSKNHYLYTARYLSEVESIDEETVRVIGEENDGCSCCPNDHHSIEFPTWYLWDPTWKEKLATELGIERKLAEAEREKKRKELKAATKTFTAEDGKTVVIVDHTGYPRGYFDGVAD